MLDPPPAAPPPTGLVRGLVLGTPAALLGWALIAGVAGLAHSVFTRRRLGRLAVQAPLCGLRLDQNRPVAAVWITAS